MCSSDGILQILLHVTRVAGRLPDDKAFRVCEEVLRVVRESGGSVGGGSAVGGTGAPQVSEWCGELCSSGRRGLKRLEAAVGGFVSGDGCDVGVGGASGVSLGAANVVPSDFQFEHRMCSDEGGCCVVDVEKCASAPVGAVRPVGVAADAPWVGSGVASELDTGASGGGVLRGPAGGVSYGRGPNYLRNQEARARRRARKGKGKDINVAVGRSDATPGINGSDGTFEGSGRFFSSCDMETRRRLANSRAERYILENEAAIRRLKAVDHEKAAQRQEKKLDTEIKFLDGQLNGDYSLCPPGRVMGWAKTLVSKSSGSKSSSDKSSPSLSKGSTSPSSSVSQNERRLEKLCKELEYKLEASEKKVEKYESQFKAVRDMTRPVMTDQDRYFGRDHDFESGNEDDGYYY